MLRPEPVERGEASDPSTERCSMSNEATLAANSLGTPTAGARRDREPSQELSSSLKMWQTGDWLTPSRAGRFVDPAVV